VIHRTIGIKNPRDVHPGDFLSELGQLVDDDDVAGLKTLGALFNSELDLLAFLQVLEAIALNGREVDKDIRAALASEKAVAFGPVEPLDCTVDTFRHFASLWQEKNMEGTHGYCIGAASTAVKQSGSRMIREPTW